MKTALLVFFCFMFLYCSAQEMIEDSLHINKIHNILIATSKSDFKQAVVENITAKSDELNCIFKIVELKELNDKALENYNAVIILNSIKIGRMSRHVRKFFKNLDEIHRKKIIIINTAKTDWKLKEDDIYAITSASKDEKADTVSDSVFLKIKEIIQIP